MAEQVLFYFMSMEFIQQLLTTIWGLSYRIFGLKHKPGSNRSEQDLFGKCLQRNKELINDIPSFDEVKPIEIADKVFSYFISTGFMSASAHDDMKT